MKHASEEKLRSGKNLKMRTFCVRVMVVPPVFMMALGDKIVSECRVIEGYTLKDAKRRAGIE